VISGDRWTGSLFTDSFILGAKGGALGSSGVVSLFSLIDFIQERVVLEKQAVNWSKSLTPQLQSLRAGDGAFFFTPATAVRPPSTTENRNQSTERKGQVGPYVTGSQAFEIAQWATQSPAAAAAEQMATQLPPESSDFVALARENQDLGVEWRDANRRLLRGFSEPDWRRNRAVVDAFHDQMGSLETRIAKVMARLEKEFPDYFTLIGARPLKVEEVQELLGGTEALVFWLPGEK
jgi:hypothetical protein